MIDSSHESPRVDVVKARQVLYQRWLQNRFVELDEPEDTEEYCYIAVLPKPEDYTDDFDFLFWEPALIALEEEVAKCEDGKFFKVDVFYEDDSLCITSSRGKYPTTSKTRADSRV